MQTFNSRSTAPILIEQVVKNLTTPQRRAWNILEKKTSRMWRDFWIRTAHEQGYSNAAIAANLEISENTVRAILKKAEQS